MTRKRSRSPRGAWSAVEPHQFSAGPPTGVLSDSETGATAIAGSNRVSLGGRWNRDARKCRAANRNRDNSEGRTPALGMKVPDSFGRYDMLGNLQEWVQDWSGEYPGGAVVDPIGAVTGMHRVTRGGGSAHAAQICRASCSNSYEPGSRRALSVSDWRGMQDNAIQSPPYRSVQREARGLGKPPVP